MYLRYWCEKGSELKEDMNELVSYFCILAFEISWIIIWEAWSECSILGGYWSERGKRDGRLSKEPGKNHEQGEPDAYRPFVLRICYDSMSN